MLLKTLLKKANEWIEANPLDTGALIVKIEASNAGITVEQFLERLDVRHVGTLRALVREAFPRKLRNGELEITKNDRGAWRVDPKEVTHG